MPGIAQLTRINATYPWFGDGEPHVWMTDVLASAVHQGRIENFEVISAKPPLTISDELMDIRFTVEMKLPEESPRLDQRLYATDILNEIVGDTDVVIHDLEPIK